MPELKTTPLANHPEPWLPSFDVHEENGELVLHADLEGFEYADVEISLDGGDLIAQAEDGSCSGCFHLPFAPQTLRLASRTDLDGLEIRIPIPTGREQS